MSSVRTSVESKSADASNAGERIKTSDVRKSVKALDVETNLLGSPRPIRRLRMALMLAWFLRLLSAVWLLKGMLSWATILGVAQVPGPTFEGGSVMFQTSTIFFAIIDLIAAVGLWLVATWGGVVWLIAMGSHGMLGYFFERAVPFDQVVAIFYGTLAVIYFVLNWAVAREAN